MSRYRIAISKLEATLRKDDKTKIVAAVAQWIRLRLSVPGSNSKHIKSGFPFIITISLWKGQKGPGLANIKLIKSVV